MATALDTSELKRLASAMRGTGAARTRAAMRRTLLKAAKHLRGEAVAQAPMRFGGLKGSGHEALDGAAMAAKVLFGNTAVAYAAVQHEHEEFAHTRAQFRAQYPRRWMPKQGYKGGSSHFLFGRHYSAWEQNEGLVRDWIEREARQSLLELVRS